MALLRDSMFLQPERSPSSVISSMFSLTESRKPDTIVSCVAEADGTLLNQVLLNFCVNICITCVAFFLDGSTTFAAFGFARLVAATSALRPLLLVWILLRLSICQRSQRRR